MHIIDGMAASCLRNVVKRSAEDAAFRNRIMNSSSIISVEIDLGFPECASELAGFILREAGTTLVKR